MKSVLIWISAAILIVVAAVGFWRWKFPYGQRTCFMPCMISGLTQYAHHHNGWFPHDATIPNRALTNLITYVATGVLAGLSGDVKEVERKILAGEPLSGAESSWVYQTGLRSDDPSELALLWDRQGGLRGNGIRMRAGDHCVAFVSGETRHIPREEWPAFTNRQATLRSEVLAGRRSLSEGKQP